MPFRAGAAVRLPAGAVRPHRPGRHRRPRRHQQPERHRRLPGGPVGAGRQLPRTTDRYCRSARSAPAGARPSKPRRAPRRCALRPRRQGVLPPPSATRRQPRGDRRRSAAAGRAVFPGRTADSRARGGHAAHGDRPLDTCPLSPAARPDGACESRRRTGRHVPGRNRRRPGLPGHDAYRCVHADMRGSGRAGRP